MRRIEISTGDFLKNAGIVGLKYLLDNSEADEGIVYGITDDGQSLWIDSEYIENADWTQLYFNAFVKKYGSSTAYQAVLDKIDNILEKLENENWDISCKENLKFIKEELKFINEKLLSNDYRLLFENIKQDVKNSEVYELLKTNELKENMGIEELCRRTFSMYDVIQKYFDYFWKEDRYFLKKKKILHMKIRI